jgi:hypothetical protein
MNNVRSGAGVDTLLVTNIANGVVLAGGVFDYNTMVRLVDFSVADKALYNQQNNQQDNPQDKPLNNDLLDCREPLPCLPISPKTTGLI